MGDNGEETSQIPMDWVQSGKELETSQILEPPGYTVQALRETPVTRSDTNLTTQSREAGDIKTGGLEMAMSCTRLKYMISKEAIGMGSCRTFAAGDALKASTLSKEVKSTTVVGSNIVKDGTDSKIMPESEYPDWLWHLLDKQPALSELRKKNVETLPYEKLERFVKLDNRARIKDSNSVRAKN
ncbi:uncharacterized protein LOC122076860 isoform X3 [Macadamia integrifolia]|nr:uncharacterized protein LOC122076860 isoform X3 [Macadamia integrifolia]